MARSTFGGSAADFAIQAPGAHSGYVLASVNLTAGTAWSAKTGGTQYTDLVAVAGGTPVCTDANGWIYQFQGPDGVTELWVDFGTGTRYHLRTSDSLAATFPPGATPTAYSTYAGARGYDPKRSAYNLKAKHLTRTRAGLAKVRAGTGFLSIGFAGDSQFAGYGAVIGTSDAPTQLLSLLSGQGYPPAGKFIPGYINLTDSRVTTTTGWTSFASSSNALWNNTTTNTLTFTTGACTGVKVRYANGNPTFTFTIRVDGGAPVTITPTSASTLAAWASGTLGNTTHTVAIAPVTAGNFPFILGVDEVYNTTSGVRVYNTGVGGTPMTYNADATFFSRTPSIASYGCDLAVIMSEVLDTSTAPATYNSQLQSAITNCRSAGADVILGTTLPPGGGTNIIPLTQQIYAIADALDLPVVDFADRWANSYTTINGAGLMFDTLHGNAAGYAEYAACLAAAILG